MKSRSAVPRYRWVRDVDIILHTLEVSRASGESFQQWGARLDAAIRINDSRPLHPQARRVAE